MEQRLTFDEVAILYRDSRPGYPEALIDDIVSYAKLRSNDPALEKLAAALVRQQRALRREVCKFSRSILDQKWSALHVRL
jgi:hypothetical protein